MSPLHTWESIAALNPAFTRSMYEALPLESKYGFFRAEYNGQAVVCRRFLQYNGEVGIYTWLWREPKLASTGSAPVAGRAGAGAPAV